MIFDDIMEKRGKEEQLVQLYRYVVIC